MNYYDVQISFVVGDRTINDQILGATDVRTFSPAGGHGPHLLVITVPDGTSIRYNLDKILYWQVHEHETYEEQEARTSKIVYSRGNNIFRNDYSNFIPKEESSDE